MGALGNEAWQNGLDSATPEHAMNEPTPTNHPQHEDFIHSEAFLKLLMQRQLKLSISCAAAFLILLIGLPLANYLAPDLMAQRVAGFPLNWLILGVLFFPYVWIIARIFITRSMALEASEVRQAAAENQQRSSRV